MMKKRITLAAALTCGLLATPATADKASAWAAHEARLDGIIAALDETLLGGGQSEIRRQHVKRLCKGVTHDAGGGEGYILPGWGRALITACAYVDELAGASAADKWSSFDIKNNCRQMKDDAGAMIKAKPVAEAPGIDRKAIHLGNDIQFLYMWLCRHKTKLHPVEHPNLTLTPA